MEPPLKRCRPKLMDSVKSSPPRKLNATGLLSVTVEKERRYVLNYIRITGNDIEFLI